MTGILDKELFELPKAIKPELNTLRYWLHLLVLAFVVLGILQLFTGGDMLNVKNILLSLPLLGFSDLIAHTLLGLD